jgi:serine protease Do
LCVGRWPCLLLVLCLCVSPGRAQEPELTQEEQARRALRRSPIVELYEKYSATVAFLTFPVPKGGNASLNEYFAVPGVHDELGVGSGFFIHESGYLLTSAHAVSTILMVAHLADGKAYPVEVIGFDRSLDLAVVRIRPERPVKTVPLARGNDVMIGETVVIIGAPHGLRQSCITGVVAAQGRDVNVTSMTLHNLLQLNAAINPGNSGGPAFNIVGEAMGVVAVHKHDGQSIGFAIPADAVRKALPRLLDVERRQGIVTGLTFAGDGSGRVKEVVTESPADAAGIKAGDVLRSIQDQRILSESDFHVGLLDHKPGDTIALKVARGKKSLLVALTLGRRPRPDSDALLARLGLKGIPLDVKGAALMHLRVPKGVVLTDVNPGLYPEKQRPEPGDVLARINDFRPEDFEHVGRLLAETPAGQSIRLVFLRHRASAMTRMDVTVSPGAK